MLLVLFLSKSGWRISTVLSFKRHPCSTPSCGIQLKDITFHFMDSKGERVLYVKIFGLFHKAQSKSSDFISLACCCNAKKYCLACYIVCFLVLRKCFKNNLLASQMKSLEALTILEERRQEFLFCNYDESGHQLMEDAPLPLNKAEKIIDMIASLLNIPRNIISLKSFRKGRAIEDFLTALYNYKENVTLKYILSVLKSNELWKSEACMNYLVYGDKIIYQTFDLFRSLRERDPSATPQGCHKFLTDFITQSYFSGEDKLGII
jgi:hypothetical protein